MIIILIILQGGHSKALGGSVSYKEATSRFIM